GGRVMTLIRATAVLIVLLAIILGLTTATVTAQEKMVDSRVQVITKVDVARLDDVEGHTMATFENKGYNLRIGRWTVNRGESEGGAGADRRLSRFAACQDPLKQTAPGTHLPGATPKPHATQPLAPCTASDGTGAASGDRCGRRRGSVRTPTPASRGSAPCK